MSAKFEMQPTDNGGFYFNLIATNGQTILTSQTYTTKESAQNGIKSVIENATDESNFETKTSSSGEDYFVLKAKNKQVIGTSQMYSGKEAMNKGIRSVINNAPKAEVIEWS